MLFLLAACNGQPGSTPTDVGTASDHTAAPTVTESPTPLLTVKESPTPLPTVKESPTPLPTVVPPGVAKPMVADPFSRWNELEPQDW